MMFKSPATLVVFGKKYLKKHLALTGFEPATFWLEEQRLSELSYGVALEKQANLVNKSTNSMYGRKFKHPK